MATPTVPTNAGAEPEIFHAATADVIALLSALLEHGGWVTSGQLGLTLHRDTARRMLRELARAGWVEAREGEGETRYRIGPELPRIGLGYLALLQAEQEQLAGRFAAATIPHTWTHGSRGQAWKPSKEPS